MSPTLRLIQPDSIDPCLDRFARHAASRVAPISTTHSLLASLQAHLSAQISEGTGDQHTLALWFALTFGTPAPGTQAARPSDGVADLHRMCVEHMASIETLHHGPLAFADASRFLMSIANNSIPPLDTPQTTETASVLTSPVAVPVPNAEASPFAADNIEVTRRPIEVWAPALLDLHLCVSAAAGFEHWRQDSVLSTKSLTSAAASKKARRLRLVG